jgi:uncharacterized protein YkwD
MVYQLLLLVFGLGWLLLSAPASGQGVDMGTNKVPPSGADQPTIHHQPPELAEVVERLIILTNAFRQKEGRPSLAPNPQLTATAQDFATFMARTGQFGHTADGQSPEARAQAHGYDVCLIAENIAFQHNPAGFTPAALAQGFFEGWQHSPGHRENLLDPAVTETGIGVAQSAQTGAYYAVQLFGRPKSQQIEFQITNTSDKAILYALDGQTVSLPPRATHTHQQCRPPEVTFQWPGTHERKTVHPSHGGRYTIIQGKAGDFRLEPG